MEGYEDDAQSTDGSTTSSCNPANPCMDESSSSDDSDSTTNCIYESFNDFDEVADRINYLPTLCNQNSRCNVGHLEVAYERMKFVLNKYKEQPHLLDPCLEQLFTSIMLLVRSENQSMLVKHRAFKYLHLILNVRGYKEAVKYFPNKISDLEFVLRFLEEQNPEDTETWETRYGLLLWLTVLIMLPFDLSLLDSGNQANTVADRLLAVGKQYIMGLLNSCLEPAALFLARVVTREDMKVVQLEPTIDWLAKNLTDVESTQGWKKIGTLQCLAKILKHGKREDLLPHAEKILSVLLTAKPDEDKYPLSSRLTTKIISRIGLVFLKPRINRWRYNRRARALEPNLRYKIQPMNAGGPRLDTEEDDDEEDEDFPATLEAIIDELISSLKSVHSTTRWSAAKGIGRLVARLNQSSGDEVISSVMDVLDFRNNEGAWNGACLALAELAKWGLLLPNRLEDLIPLITKALVYEERRGSASVGTNVRDSACYVCWAIFRAYDSSVMEPYIMDVVKVLLAVACFDREVNCRRAAAAAFQEGVGRLDNIPHGIEISTSADYFNVGTRSFSYLTVSPSIAKYNEYTRAMIDHLMKHKVNSWDPAVRKLTAQALFKLTSFTPEYVSDHCLPTLLFNVETMDLYSRHGSILAIGEILHALSKIGNHIFGEDLLNQVENMVPYLRENFLLVGHSSKPANLACLNFIENCSLAKLPFHGKDVIAVWQDLVDSCLDNESMELRLTASSALKHLCEEYYTDEATNNIAETRSKIVVKYISYLNSNKHTSRIGYSNALGSLPLLMLRGYLPQICQALVHCSQITKSTVLWAEARASALKALSNICTTMRLTNADPDSNCSEYVVGVLDTLTRGFHDYTIDDRGDIGAWVREAAMVGFMEVLIMTVDEAIDLIPRDVNRAFLNIAQQAMEKIDRTRGIAVRAFLSLLHKEGTPVPYIPAEDAVREIFNKEECRSINVINPQQTFPKFIKLLTIPEYSYNVMLGLTASAGGITESLAKCAFQAMSDHLRTQTLETLHKLCDTTMDIFHKYSCDDRITVPLLTFLERALESDCLDMVLNNPDATFPLQLLHYGKFEISKTTNSKKLIVGVSYFCQLAQIRGVVGRRALMQLTILLCHRYLWLRRFTANKMYDTLMVYGDDSEYQESTIEAAKILLSETQWDSTDITTVRGKRNELCNILGIPRPIPVTRT